MATITLTDLLGRLRDRLSATTSDMLHTDARLTQDINDGLAALAEERDWPWLEATTTISLIAGTSSYALPTGCTRIHTLSISGQEPLTEVQYDEYLRLNKQTGSVQPCVYTRVGGNILVAPTPSAAATLDVYYQKEETVLVSGTDQPLTPARYSALIVSYAATYSAVRTRDQEMIAAMQTLRSSELQRTYDALTISDSGPRIDTRRDNWV